MEREMEAMNDACQGAEQTMSPVEDKVIKHWEKHCNDFFFHKNVTNPEFLATFCPANFRQFSCFVFLILCAAGEHFKYF